MPRVKIEKTIESLKKEKEEVDRRLKIALDKKVVVEKKREQRRNLFVGQVALKYMRTNPNDDFSVMLRKLLLEKGMDVPDQGAE
jgi:hypothetical protein